LCLKVSVSNFGHEVPSTIDSKPLCWLSAHKIGSITSRFTNCARVIIEKDEAPMKVAFIALALSCFLKSPALARVGSLTVGIVAK